VARRRGGAAPQQADGRRCAGFQFVGQLQVSSVISRNRTPASSARKTQRNYVNVLKAKQTSMQRWFHDQRGVVFLGCVILCLLVLILTAAAAAGKQYLQQILLAVCCNRSHSQLK
jgi:hypothetical protein